MLGLSAWSWTRVDGRMTDPQIRLSTSCPTGKGEARAVATKSRKSIVGFILNLLVGYDGVCEASLGWLYCLKSEE